VAWRHSDDRRYPSPIIGVGALILRRDRILMAQRGKQPLIGWWSLPGGRAGASRMMRSKISSTPAADVEAGLLAHLAAHGSARALADFQRAAGRDHQPNERLLAALRHEDAVASQNERAHADDGRWG